MQGLKLTYETLGHTRNEAAVDVLLRALEDQDAGNRRRALSAFLLRTEGRSPQAVLENWHLLQADDLRVLRPKKQWIASAIDQALREGGDQVERAIDAAKTIGLTTAIPQLALLAESSGSRAIRLKTSEAILEMVEPLGREARADRDQPTVRGPVLSRLADSVRRYSMHKNHKLVDAFLIVVTWGDADFRQLLGEKSPQLEVICERLLACQANAINELVSGFLRRRNVPDRIATIIHGRTSVEFRDSLLRTISNEPSTTLLRNLSELGLPSSCEGGEALMREITPQYRSALAYLYVASDNDEISKLHLIATLVECGGPNSEITAAHCFSRCEVPAIETWMRAAVPIADNNEAVIANDENARLLQRLINLLDHPDASLVRSVRRILAPLHAEEMLVRFESLRPRTRRKLGRVVLMIDPDAIDKIRDALRHPVLTNRLAAIATADALAVVDLLSDSFKHISREDHQEARIQAADVMSTAQGDTTLELLREMVDLPESPVRDAAITALQKREPAVT